MICKDCKRILPKWKVHHSRCLNCTHKLEKEVERRKEVIKQWEKEQAEDVNPVIAWLRK